MTTEAAAAEYLAQHNAELAGKGYAIFNPHGKPVADLPVIYGFNNGGARHWLKGQLLAEDGTALGSHICSDEGYMPNDLGVLEGTRPDRHETFQEHYPDGYRMEFVPLSAFKGHSGLGAAVELNHAKGKETR